MHLEQNLLLFLAPLRIDDVGIQVVVVSSSSEELPFPALLSRPPADSELSLHQSRNIGPFAFTSFLSQQSQNLVLFLAPNFSFRH